MRRVFLRRCLASLVFLLTSLSVSVGEETQKLQKETGSQKPVHTTSPRIEWDHSTISLIHSNAGYCRIIRLKDNRLLCGFDYRGRIWVRHSDDDGKSWRTLIKVAEWPSGPLTNTELLQLQDGTLLCMYNERPRSSQANSQSAQRPPFSICTVRSEDGGQTWQEPKRIYSAGREFTNGCWEPAAIQLPSGEIQLFFSNENPYRNSDEQDITLLRSTDGAQTWSAPEIVSFRPGHRDGMAVPLLLKDGAGIAFSIEDNGLSGNFKPVIVLTTLKDNWRSGTRHPGNTNRWSALREMPPPHVAASAPYLTQMPSGETILSYQQTETGQMKDAYMVVSIGDPFARNFGSASIPFPTSGRQEQLWNSVFVRNDETIIAVSQTVISNTPGIWSVEGRFIKDRR